MFTILLVPILYSVGLAANSDVITYTGAGNITAIGFASAMFQMSQSMFIFNVIFAAIIGRSLASEIENKSIRLYINRVGVRKLIYFGKEHVQVSGGCMPPTAEQMEQLHEKYGLLADVVCW